jgi:hypothetical protein
MSLRHDHNHRLCFPICDEIIKNDVRPAVHDPAVLRLAVSVQQVKHRIFCAALVIVRRRIDSNPPSYSHRLRLIKDNPDFSVRHRSGIVKGRHLTRHLDETGNCETRRDRFDCRVRRVCCLNALDSKVADPDLGRKRPKSRGPDSVLGFVMARIV